MTKTVSDLNDAQEGGVYKFTDNTLNRPISYGTCLVMVMQNNRYYQLAYGFDNVATCHTFFRMCAGSWTAWQEVSADIPSFYKNYATIADLATGLNAQFQVERTKLESINSNSQRQIPNTKRGGLLIVTNAASGVTESIAIPYYISFEPISVMGGKATVRRDIDNADILLLNSTGQTNNFAYVYIGLPM